MKIHQRLFWFLILLLPVQLGRHFWPASSYLLGIRIDYLAPTVYLTDLLLLAILILWGAEKIKARKKITFPYLKYGWVLAFLILLFLNAFLAQNQTAAFYKLIKIIEFSLLGFYLAQNKFSLNFYQKPLLAAVIYSSLLALAQFLSQSSLGGPFWWLGERTFDLSTPGIAKAVFNGQLLLRPYATFSHPNALAGFILVALIILVPTGWLRLRAVKRIGIALGILAIIFSFSRSVWFLGLLLAFLWLGKSLWFSKINKNWGFLVGGLFLIISFWVFYLAPHFSTNEALFQRLQLMKAAWLMIKDFSLAGVGLNNFIVRLPEYWAQTGFTYWLQPVHNFYLLWLVEVGWVGLLIWLWFLFLTFKRLFPLQGQRGTLLLALMAILILGSFDHYWLTLQQNQLLLTVILGTVWSSQS